MTKLKMTAEKAMEILDIPPEEHEKYALMLKEINSTRTYDAQSFAQAYEKAWNEGF